MTFVFYYIILKKDETQKSLVELKPCEWLYSPAHYPLGTMGSHEDVNIFRDRHEQQMWGKVI